MNLDPLSFALAEISYSVANLTKKNYKTSVTEINHLVKQHGAEADRHLFRCLFSHIDFSGDGKSSGKDFHQIQFLVQECAGLLSKPNFISILCYAVDNPLLQQKSLRPSAQLLPQLSKVLKLSRVQEVVFAFALLNSSNSETRQYSSQFLKQKLPDLLHSYVDADTTARQEGGLQDAGIEALHLLLSHLFHGRDTFGIGKEQKEALLKTLQRELEVSFADFPPNRVPAVLSPFLYSEIEDIPLSKLTDFTNMPHSLMETSLADLLLEAGYSCTSSLEECRGVVGQVGIRELTTSSVAFVLGMMAKTPTGVGDQNQQAQSGGWGDRPETPGVSTWNVEVFVQTIQEMVPSLNWKEVVQQLDHPGFHIVGKKGLQLLVQALFRGLQQEPFPIQNIYQTWNNTEGQLSFVINSLRHNDVFCFADYPGNLVVTEALKSTPNDEDREVATWKSLDLVEVLLRLSEVGHYQTVYEAFKVPMNRCPDILVLALLQSKPTWNTLKQELISSLMSVFLGSHPNSAVVLHHAWHHQGHSSTIRTLIMHSMAEWYMRGEPHDQVRLSRILDVAQDLKSLSMLLNSTPYAFVVDLACLASRREYLKLDKWLGDKINEHKEPFIQACVVFLKRRCPQLIGAGKEEQPQAKSQQLPPETIIIMLNCLKAFVGHVSQELREAINTMCNNASMYISKIRSNSGATVGPKPPHSFPQAMVSQIEQMNMGPVMGQQQPPVGGGPGPPGGGVFSQNVPSLNPGTPGSPARSFPGMTPQPNGSNPSFNPMPALNSQFQNLGFQNTSSMGPPRNPVNSLASLSIQVASRPPVPNERLGNRTAPTSAADMSAIFPEMQQTFSKEVEDRANSYFQQIYNQPPSSNMPIDQVLEMLSRFKDSQDKMEKDVFACMLRNLFEEYRFFPNYPERELQITAILFGGIIDQGIVTYWNLGIALRYILEALRKKHGSNMYYFGITALDRFKTKLKDYPQYCQHLTAIPHFNQFPSHLIEYIEYGARGQEPPQATQPTQPDAVPSSMLPMASSAGSAPINPPRSTPMDMGIGPNSAQGSLGLQGALGGPTGAASAAPAPAPVQVSASQAQPSQPPIAAVAATAPTGTTAMRAFPKPSIATATNIDTLLAGQGKEEISVPPEPLQDKVFFIFNNLSLANMTQKGEELKEQVADEYIPWVSQYLVMRRASIEPNFHTLYSCFVDVLKIPTLTQMVIKETYRNIKVLLRSDKGAANFSDRTLLKNLGHWLGMLTLAKNKPILTVDIDLKGLVYEAYQKGSQELLYVVPFAAKVLESCSKSKVFKVPNPWTMAMMNVLAELHQEQELKLNLKFEIEVLCKTLGLDVNELKPTTYLKDPTRMPLIEHQLSAPVPKEVLLPPDDIPPPTQPPPNLSMPFSISQVPVSMPPPVPMPALPPAVGYPNYDSINTNMATFSQQLIFSDNHPLLQANPVLKQVIRPTIERTVSELILPVVERSIKIALTTCEQIVKKDFALDPDENRMRTAAHCMARNITAGLALITCREPIMMQIAANLKQAFLTTLRGAAQQQKELIEQTAQVITNEVIEFCSAFIQKTAVERCIPEIDKRLATEFDLRKHARNEGRRYCDPIILTYQAERMPEQIRLKVGAVTPQQLTVYEEFARNIPGFMPATHDIYPPVVGKPFLPQQQQQPPPPPPPPLPQQQQQSMPSLPQPQQQPPPPPSVPPPQFAPDEVLIYDRIIRELEQHLQIVPMLHNNHIATHLHNLLDTAIQARNTREPRAAIALLQKAVEGLLDQYSLSSINDQELLLRFRECNLLVLKGLQDNSAFGNATSKEVTRCLISCHDDFRYNIDAVDILIRSGLVSLQQYDVFLSSVIENGLNSVAVSFAMQLLQRLCIEEKHPSNGISESDFPNTIETLTSIASRSRGSPDGLESLVNMLRNPDTNGMPIDRTSGGPTSMMQSGISQAREFDDPPGLHEKTEYLLREWVNMYHSPAAGRDSTKAFTCFVQQMHQQSILKTDELITRFFRLCTEMCVDLCYRALSEQTHNPTLVRAKCFHTLDAYVRLIALLVKHSGDTTNTITKINLLNKVLGIVAGVLLQDHEVRYTEFQQLPYHRIFIMLFIELNAPEPILESINYQVLAAFCQVFHILRPAKAPGFAYAWLELISHRVFIGRLLALTPHQRGWGMYAQLLMDLFKLLAPFLRNADLNKPTQLLYKGTLRVLLVLLHDFPEFLCDYHYTFCDVIPPNCIQMRNLVLSAFPRQMRLPDPFTPNLKVDNLPDITQAPRILTNYVGIIQPPSFKKDLESYLKTRSPITFLSDLKSNLQSTESGCHYNIQLINALVLYVGTQAIQHVHSKGQTPSISTIAPSSHMDIFQNLAVNLDTEGRYLFLTAISNQLRYPNSHTHYFSCTLLYLFAQANNEAIQEQITRVLLERLIVNRPHPWGLLITFIELIKNPTYKFWNHEFVHCAPEIQKLFESVARSCMQPKQTTNVRDPDNPAEAH